jgi:hypothetical protein
MENKKMKIAFVVTRVRVFLQSPITTDLPYILFGANDRPANYVSFLADLLPAGVTMSSIFTDVATGKIVLEYSQGANKEHVIIEFVSQMSYQSFLNGLTNFTVPKVYFKKATLIVNDVTVDSFLDREVEIGIINDMGTKSMITVIPNTQREPNNPNSNMVNIEVEEQEINSEFGIVGLLPPGAYSTGWTLDSYQKTKK